jgi:endoglucanase
MNRHEVKSVFLRWLLFVFIIVQLVGCNGGGGSTSGTIGNGTASYLISGSVTLNGVALAGVTVSTGSASGITDNSGNYTISSLANGSCTVTPTLSGYTFSPTSLPVTVSGANQSGINFAATVTTTPATLRGVNVGGMEMAYTAYSQATGPIAGTDYPVLDTRLIDYLASKHVNTIRFLFSWEGMQSALYGPIPASNTGNYKDYFDNYKRIVDYATQVKGISVVIEPWQADSSGGTGGARWRGDLVGSAAVPSAAFADFWSKMAGQFAGNPLVSYGLINEPNSMSTMSWWASAQAAVTAIRNAGSTQRIYVPGNGWTGASSWTSNWYDTATPQYSNAYGWLNANGVGVPISDPQNNMAAEVHTYLDTNQDGTTNEITSVTAARDQIAVALNEAAAHGYQIYLGEIGFYAGTANASAAWADFISYFQANPDVFTGFTWWAAGDPDWWNDVQAPYFSVSPTDSVNYTGDTVNMTMIQSSF